MLSEPSPHDRACLEAHLQAAVDIEFWTIPYYMSVLYSIKDPSHRAYRLIQSVVYQEMFHLELASNIANAYGYSPEFNTLEEYPYRGCKLPHLEFKFSPASNGRSNCEDPQQCPDPALFKDPDHPEHWKIYCPYSAAIGPLDETRLNTMCLIEYPKWGDGQEITALMELMRERISDRLEIFGRSDRTETLSVSQRKKQLANLYRQQIRESYSSIGEFYDALTLVIARHVDEIKPKHNQINFFGSFYKQFTEPTITEKGGQGLEQALRAIRLIQYQGEGKKQGDLEIPPEYRNTADGFEESWSHYTKFKAIRNSKDRPEIYHGIANPEPGSPGYIAQQILLDNFDEFIEIITELFSTGRAPGKFSSVMATLGGNILTCWQKGAIPKFTR